MQGKMSGKKIRDKKMERKKSMEKKKSYCGHYCGKHSWRFKNSKCSWVPTPGPALQILLFINIGFQYCLFKRFPHKPEMTTIR